MKNWSCKACKKPARPWCPRRHDDRRDRSEINARIHERSFEHLDAPVARTASLDTAFPFAQDSSDNFMANDGLEGRPSGGPHRCADSATGGRRARCTTRGFLIIASTCLMSPFKTPLASKSLSFLNHDHGLFDLVWHSCTQPDSVSPPPCHGPAQSQTQRLPQVRFRFSDVVLHGHAAKQK